MTINFEVFKRILLEDIDLKDSTGYSELLNQLTSLDSTLTANTIGNIFNYCYMRKRSSLSIDEKFLFALYENFITRTGTHVLDSYGQVININDIVITGYFVHHVVLGFTSIGTIKTLNLSTNRISYKNRFGVYKLPNV